MRKVKLNQSLFNYHQLNKIIKQLGLLNLNKLDLIQILVKVETDQQDIQSKGIIIQTTIFNERLKNDGLKRQLEEQAQLEKTQQKDQLKRETYIVLAKQHNEMIEKYFKQFTKLQEVGQLINKKIISKRERIRKRVSMNKLKKQKLLAERKKFMNDKDRDHFENKKERVLEMRKQRKAQKLEHQMQLKQKIYDMRVVQLKEQEDNYMQRVKSMQKNYKDMRKKQQDKKSRRNTFRLRQLKLQEAFKEKEKVDAIKEQVLKINALQQYLYEKNNKKKFLGNVIKNYRIIIKNINNIMIIKLRKKTKLARRDQYMNEHKESKQIELRAQQDRDISL
ncbi:unnamed protein product [Paramecium primaurelia]|uniref:Uncharacterized protein n=1 Tax=Paramecium primaurelia TaxID=5886 RepID=A0A8S1L4L8_PARPR|nr:unnamed protein product [Paramecium primaurelia]